MPDFDSRILEEHFRLADQIAEAHAVGFLSTTRLARKIRLRTDILVVLKYVREMGFLEGSSDRA